MTNFTKKSFSVAVGSKDYREGYDRIFGSKEWESTEHDTPSIDLGPLAERFTANLTSKERELLDRMQSDPKRRTEIEATAAEAVERARASYERTKRLPRNPIVDALLGRGKGAKAKR